jgi:uncharacterized protein (DUF2141 family)
MRSNCARSNRLLRSAAFASLVVLPLLLATAAAQQTGQIVVKVMGLPSDEGEVRFGLYDNAIAFKKGIGSSIRKGTCSPIKAHQCEFVIPDVPYGLYAILVGHDKNRNGRIDWERGERGGASNYKGRLWSHPDFDKAKFLLNEPKKSLEISLS